MIFTFIVCFIDIMITLMKNFLHVPGVSTDDRSWSFYPLGMTGFDRITICFHKYHRFFISTEVKSQNLFFSVDTQGTIVFSGDRTRKNENENDCLTTVFTTKLTTSFVNAKLAVPTVTFFETPRQKKICLLMLIHRLFPSQFQVRNIIQNVFEFCNVNQGTIEHDIIF